MERVNQEIEHYLRVFINHHQSDWSEWTPLIEFAYNNRVSSVTKVTPFYADKGQHPYTGIEPMPHSDNPTALEFAENMKKIREEVGSALKKASEDMSKYYDKRRNESRQYKAGDLVWLEGTNLTTERPMKKLDDKHFGPLEKVGKSAYKLKVPRTWKHVHPVFNEMLLTPYHAPEFPTQPRNHRPPPRTATW